MLPIKLSKTAKQMLLLMCILILAALVVSILYYRSLGFLPFAYGLLIGGGVSVLKVLLLERAIDKALQKEQKAAGAYIQLQQLLRLFLTGGALLLSALVPEISLLGAAVGVFTYPIAIYGTRLFPGS